MTRRRVGVLELLSDSVEQGWGRRFYGRRFRRHYASIMPQAVSAWCRELGHDVTYAIYYGQQDPRTLLPPELDVVFISTYTHASAAAMALARLFDREGTLTVIGGPHARSFPADCQRFFDIVVARCDKDLVDDIVSGRFAPGSVADSGRPLTDIPSVESRLPEITKSSLTEGRRPMGANVPMLSSVGCPYTCDFCLDWNNPYIAIAPERLVEDLRFVAEKLPGVFVSFHDPNFGVSFDKTMAALETVPASARNPYFMESSLTILKPGRLQRLRDTNCHYVAPGVESWADYSHKAGVGQQVGREKLAGVLAQFHELHEHVPNLQANFIFGADQDAGDEPVELTSEFIRGAPFVWPVINIPTPFGGTPQYDRQLAAGRILEAMPFSFYYMPYLVMTLENYSPLEYYERMVTLCERAYSWSLLPARIAGTPSAAMKAINVLRTFGGQGIVRRLRGVRDRLASDAQFRAFHEGRDRRLPDVYRQMHASRLGRYAELLTDDEIAPRLEPAPPQAARAPASAPPRVAVTALHPPPTAPAAARAAAAD